MGDIYSPTYHCVIAYDNITQEMFAKQTRSNNKLLGGAPQVVHLKWECTSIPTIFKHEHPIDYVGVDANGRRNHQCSTIINVKLKKAMECAVAEAEVDVEQIDVFWFIQPRE